MTSADVDSASATSARGRARTFEALRSRRAWVPPLRFTLTWFVFVLTRGHGGRVVEQWRAAVTMIFLDALHNNLTLVIFGIVGTCIALLGVNALGRSREWITRRPGASSPHI